MTSGGMRLQELLGAKVNLAALIARAHGQLLHLLQKPLFRSPGQAVRFRPKAWVRIASLPGLARIIHANHLRREGAAAWFGAGSKLGVRG